MTDSGSGSVAGSTARVTWQDGALKLAFETVNDLDAFVEACRDQDGFLVTLSRELKLYDRLDAELAVDDLRCRLPAEVMQVFPSVDATFATALRVRDWAPLPVAELLRRRRTNPASDAGDETSGAHPADVSPAHRIREIKNPTHRFQLATRASRTERQILLRDTSPQVLLGLLAHPRIEDSEVLEIVKSNYASAAILQRVAENRRWMSNLEIQRAVVRSQKTPPTLAIKLLPLLPTPDLRFLAKMGNARETLRKAALRVYLERQKGHGP